MASRQWLPNSMSTEIGNTSGSTKMSAASIPLPSAASMMRVALSARSPAPAGMPDSPAAVTTTRVSNRFTSSSTSIRSRDAEFISGRPARPASTTSSPVRIVSLLEESIESGVEPVSCTMPASHAMACCCSSGLSGHLVDVQVQVVRAGALLALHQRGQVLHRDRGVGAAGHRRAHRDAHVLDAAFLVVLPALDVVRDRQIAVVAATVPEAHRLAPRRAPPRCACRGAAARGWCVCSRLSS